MKNVLRSPYVRYLDWAESVSSNLNFVALADLPEIN